MGDLTVTPYFTARTPPSLGTSILGPGADIEAFANSLTVKASVLAAVSASVPWLDVTAAAYGADKTGATDSSTALVAALDAGIALAPPGFVVLFPPGIYLLSSAVVKTALTKNIELLGMGVGISVILVDNATGGLSFDFASRDNTFRFSGLEVKAGRADVPYGLEIEFPPASTASHQRQVAVSDCYFHADDTAVDYFRACITCEDIQNSVFYNVSTSAKATQAASECEVGLALYEFSMNVIIRDCSFNEADTGILGLDRVSSIYIYGGRHKDNYVGVNILNEPAAGKSHFVVSGARFLSKTTGLKFTECRDGYITNCTLEPSTSIAATGGLYDDILLEDFLNWVIVGNTARVEGLNFTSSVTANFLDLNGTLGEADNCIVAHNILTSRDILYDVAANCRNIDIYDNMESLPMAGATVLSDGTPSNVNSVRYKPTLNEMNVAFTDDATPAVGRTSVIKVSTASTLSITGFDFVGSAETPGHIIVCWAQSAGITLVDSSSLRLPSQANHIMDSDDRYIFQRSTNTTGTSHWHCIGIIRGLTAGVSRAVSSNAITVDSTHDYVEISTNTATLNTITVASANQVGRKIMIKFIGTGPHTVSNSAGNIRHSSGGDVVLAQNGAMFLMQYPGSLWQSEQ